MLNYQRVTIIVKPLSYGDYSERTLTSTISVSYIYDGWWTFSIIATLKKRQNSWKPRDCNLLRPGKSVVSFWGLLHFWPFHGTVLNKRDYASCDLLVIYPEVRKSYRNALWAISESEVCHKICCMTRHKAYGRYIYI